MSLPTLPGEIHELIVESITSWNPAERRNAWSTCALVCTSWHSFALRYMFQTITLARDGRNGAVPLGDMVRLMERYPEIPSCVNSISIVFSRSGELPPFNEDEFEQICRLCTIVYDLSIRQAGPELDSFPRIRNGLLLLLKSPSLRHLTFSSTFRTSFFETVSQHLKVLSFNHVTSVSLDHEDPSKLSKSLRKVELRSSNFFIGAIQYNPALFQLVRSTQHINIITDSKTIRVPSFWDYRLDWAGCTLMDLSFAFSSRELSHIFPSPDSTV